MRLLFLHGWGFDASLWDGLRRALAPLETLAWDRGYYRAPRQDPPGGPVLAIGHSLGAMILASDPPPGCVGLVAINGFDRFAGRGLVPARLVAQMRRLFAVAPDEVLDGFRDRCGAGPHPGETNAARLAADLDRLATGDARGHARPLLVLHGGADPILPAGMQAAVFPDAPRATLADGGHLLPLTHPAWCAAQIRAVLP